MSPWRISRHTNGATFHPMMHIRPRHSSNPRRAARLAQCDRLEAALREAVVNWRCYPVVLGLPAMRGIQFTTAVGMLAELGDPS